jgi:hypothetical protein
VVGSRGGRRALRPVAALVAGLLLLTSCTSDETPHRDDAVLARGNGTVELGNLRVELVGSTSEVSVAAPELTTEEYDGLHGWLEAGMLTGAPVELTIEGDPSDGVRLTRTYAVPLPADATATLAYYDEDLGEWLAVPSDLSADRRSVTAVVDHLSLWDDFVATGGQAGDSFRQGLDKAGQAVKDTASAVYDGARQFSDAIQQGLADAADDMYYYAGKVFDVRVDEPACVGEEPDWVDSVVVIDANRNNSVLWCTGHDAKHPELLVVKARVNRGFAMLPKPAVAATWTYNSTFDQGLFDASVEAVTELDAVVGQSIAQLTGGLSIVGAGQEISYGFSERQARRLPIGTPLLSLTLPSTVSFLATTLAQLVIRQSEDMLDGMLAAVIAVATCARSVHEADDFPKAAKALLTCVRSADEAIAKNVGVALVKREKDPRKAGQLAGKLVGRISIGLGLIGPAFNAMNYAAERGVPQSARDATVFLRAGSGGTKTEVVTIDPFGSDGRLDAGWQVDDQTSGAPVDCSYDIGSWSATTGGTHDCGSTADSTHSCWAPADRLGQLLCLFDPWTDVLVARAAVNVPADTTRQEAPQPLGIELEDSTKWWLRHGGSWGGRADELVGAYGCQGGACSYEATGRELAVLTGYDDVSAIDTSGPVWTVRVGELGRPDVDYPPPTQMAVTRAWFIASNS